MIVLGLGDCEMILGLIADVQAAVLGCEVIRCP